MLGNLDSHVQKDATWPLPYSLLKNQLKCIKYLNLTSKIIKFPEKHTHTHTHTQVNSLTSALVMTFWSDTKHKNNNSKHKSGQLYQTKKHFHSEENYQQNKKQLMEWEKVFANHVSHKRLISKMCKNSYNSIAQNQITQLKYMHKLWTDIFEKITEMIKMYMKRCSTSLSPGKCKSKQKWESTS